MIGISMQRHYWTADLISFLGFGVCFSISCILVRRRVALEDVGFCLCTLILTPICFPLNLADKNKRYIPKPQKSSATIYSPNSNCRSLKHLEINAPIKR